MMGVTLLLLAIPCSAQEPPQRDTTGAQRDSLERARPRFELPELRARVPAGQTLYSSYSLERVTSRLSGEAIADWVRGLPGVQVRARGLGGSETISIRGSRAQDVRVTLDGIPLDDPLTGAADLSLIPAASIESARLTSGAGAAPGWGGTSGALELRSRASPPGVRVRALAGSLGRRVTEVEAGWGGEMGTVSLFGRAAGARNDFAYENRILPDPPTEQRRNADTDSWHLLGRGALASAPISLLVRIDGVERGAPGRMGNDLWDRARWRERRASVSAGWRGDGDGSEASLGWSRTSQVYRDPRVNREDGIAAQQVVGTGSLVVPGRVQLEWTGTWAEVDGDRIGSRARWTGGVRAARTTTIGSHLRLDAAVTLDGDAEGLAVSPALGLGLDLGRGWRLRARASQARRLPTFADLFLRPGMGALPNPDLRPERVVLDAEFGVEWRVQGVSARSTLFRRHTRDPIIWLPSVIAVWTPRNLGTLDATGLELGVTVEPTASWRIDAAGTWQSSHVTFANDASSPLPYEPRLSGSLTVRHAGATRGIMATVALVGRRNTNLFGLHDLPPYALLNIRARQTFHLVGLSAELEAGVVNALDMTYERVELFPEPGRRLEIGLSIGIGHRSRLPGASSDQNFPAAADGEGQTPDSPAAGQRVHAKSGL